MKTVITCLLGFILLLAIINYGLSEGAQTDGRIWNNGICACGGHWEFMGTTHGDRNTYNYKCDRCNDLFNSHKYFH